MTSVWTQNRQLNLAYEKCFLLRIAKEKYRANDQNLNILDYIIESNPIEKKNFITDLGVIISNDMNWSHHIDMIYKKASCRSYQILKCLRSKNIWILIKLFKTYVRPILESNTSVWSPFYLKDISHIESIQRSYTRTAFRRCGIAFSSYGDRLKKINLKSLEERRLVFDLLLVYKIIYGLCDLDFTDFFIFKNTKYNLRRHSLQIKCTKDNLSQKWQNSYFCRVVKLWNWLSENVVRSINIFSLKKKLFSTNLSQFLKLSL